MARDPRYDILFEPVKIGPVTARNRFYQVPHCNGMGHSWPETVAAMRAMKAEGGWAVVCTEEVEIHPLSDLSPYAEGRLWDDRDIPGLARMADAVHEYDSLAGIELVFSGHGATNRVSREVPMAPSHLVVDAYDPMQARAMDRADIRAVRDWHRQAALRSKQAGFDIIYVYAGHNLSIASHFLSRKFNHRSDEYGGSLENRVRLLRELIEDTKDAVGDVCAAALYPESNHGRRVASPLASRTHRATDIGYARPNRRWRPCRSGMCAGARSTRLCGNAGRRAGEIWRPG